MTSHMYPWMGLELLLYTTTYTICPSFSSSISFELYPNSSRTWKDVLGTAPVKGAHDPIPQTYVVTTTAVGVSRAFSYRHKILLGRQP